MGQRYLTLETPMSKLQDHYNTLKRLKYLLPEAEEMLTLKDSQQRVVTISKEDKNQNGKKNTEMKLTGKKARNLSRKRAKIEKLLKVP
jgi:hypothetical protein